MNRSPTQMVYTPAAPVVVDAILKQFGNVDRRAVVLSLSNLERVGLCFNRMDTFHHEDGEWIKHEGHGWGVTPYGRKFISAVSKPGAYWHDAEEARMLAISDQVKREMAERRQRRQRRKRAAKNRQD